MCTYKGHSHIRQNKHNILGILIRLAWTLKRTQRPTCAVLKNNDTEKKLLFFFFWFKVNWKKISDQLRGSRRYSIGIIVLSVIRLKLFWFSFRRYQIAKKMSVWYQHSEWHNVCLNCVPKESLFRLPQRPCTMYNSTSCYIII